MNRDDLIKLLTTLSPAGWVLTRITEQGVEHLSSGSVSDKFSLASFAMKLTEMEFEKDYSKANLN